MFSVDRSHGAAVLILWTGHLKETQARCQATRFVKFWLSVLEDIFFKAARNRRNLLKSLSKFLIKFVAGRAEIGRKLGQNLRHSMTRRAGTYRMRRNTAGPRKGHRRAENPRGAVPRHGRVRRGSGHDV